MHQSHAALLQLAQPCCWVDTLLLCSLLWIAASWKPPSEPQPHKWRFAGVNAFGLTQFDNETSFFGGNPVMSQVQSHSDPHLMIQCLEVL
jgi:hypothetical protein